MIDRDHPLLFEGRYVAKTGRFSCETVLMRDCPEEFKDPCNAWTKYALDAVLLRSVSYENWTWKPFTRPERERRESCFTGLLFAAWNVDPALEKQILSRAAVLGWMLSEMLVRTPEFRCLDHDFHDH